MNNFKNAEKVWKEGITFIKYVVDTVREPFLILDKDLKIVSANESFYNFFLTEEKETEGRMIYDIGNKQWDIPHLRKLLEDILPKNTFFKNYEIEHVFPTIGKKFLALNARMVFVDEEGAPMIILAMEDITKQKILEDKLALYAKELEEKVLERTKELGERLDELEKVNRFMVGRELKMVELKKTVKDLQDTVGDLKVRLEKEAQLEKRTS